MIVLIVLWIVVALVFGWVFGSVAKEMEKRG